MTKSFIAFMIFSLIQLSVKSQIPAGVEGFKSKVKPFLSKYCIECHGPKKSKGKITVHTLDGDLMSGVGLDYWENILDTLKAGEMPPEEEKQPTESEVKEILTWIDKGLEKYVKNAKSKSTQPITRRLTNFEYQNTMRDLLGFELDLASTLPEDPMKPYKFNNQAKYMLMGKEQLGLYRANARRAMASAIVDPKKPKVYKTKRDWELNDNTNPANPRNDELKGSRYDPALRIKSWPKTGEFRVRIKAAGIFPKGTSEVPMNVVMGYFFTKSSVVKDMGTFAVKNNVDNPEIYEIRGRIEDIPKQPQFNKKDNSYSYSITITPQNIFDDGRRNDGVSSLKKPRIAVQSIEFESPIAETWPPKHHTDILFESSLRKSDPKAYVAAVLEKFMTRAFRRPVTEDEVLIYEEIFNRVKGDFPTFEEAMRETLALVLISPEFMYHTCGDTHNKQYEIASRLSYFLWGSMPDNTLFELASKGKLTDPQVIESQVTRMLKDKRSSDFVKNFTMQWLDIAKMKSIVINQKLFPRFLYTVDRGENFGREVPYIPTVRDYMLDETVGFIGELIKRNASVLNIVDSDFAFLNERLAYHYGVEGVKGHELRPVPVKPEHKLGGLLTHGSVLIANSTGSAPHPIYRAVWLRDAILGDHVKEPPANVPALSDTAGEVAEKALSIKELLVKHREVESCNDCHVRLDPWGVPFEEYNAIGQYQPLVPKEGTLVRGMKKETEQQYKKYLKSIFTEKVDAEARVPNGPKVTGIDDLKKHLLKDRKNDIAKNMIKNLMIYGIGREMTYHDRYIIEELSNKLKENNYKLQDMIIAVCQSELFIGGKK